ncbi:ankyrin [Hypoxylon sp. FL1284]|nr:ankyrin [Hypoxylon sp. FL1284]
MERSDREELSLESKEPPLGEEGFLTTPSSKWYQNPHENDESNDPDRYLTFYQVIEAADKHHVPSIPIDSLGVQLDGSSQREMFALGSGASSEIIQHVTGEDTKHIVPPKTTVAVKIFRAQGQDNDAKIDPEAKPDLEARRGVYKAILSEIQTAFQASLRGHPNLAQPLFVGWLKENQFPVLAMQLGDYGSLDLILRAAHTKLSATETWHIIFDIALGLRAIHRAELAHGDLKPDNILVMAHTDPSRPLIAKLSDFGGSFQSTRQHPSRPVHVTPMWCAPEVVNHDPGIDWRKADVYSFGLIMGSLWTAEHGKVMEKLGRRSSCFLSFPHNEDEEEDWLWAVKSSADGCIQVLEQILERPLTGGSLPEKENIAELLGLIAPTLHRYFWRRPSISDLLQSLRSFEGETGRDILGEDEAAANKCVPPQGAAGSTKSWTDNSKFSEINFEQCSFAAEDFRSLLDHWDSSPDIDIPQQAPTDDELFDNCHHIMTYLFPPKFFESSACLARSGARAQLAHLSWELAMCHYFGKGTPSNLELVLKWTRISAVCGSIKAMHVASLVATETTNEPWFPTRLCLSLLALSGSSLAQERLSIKWPHLFQAIREIIQERHLAYQTVKEQPGDMLHLHTLGPYYNLRYPAVSSRTVEKAIDTGDTDEIAQIIDGSIAAEDMDRIRPDLLHWLVHLTDQDASTLAASAFERGARLDALFKCVSPFLGAKPVIDTVFSPLSSAIIQGKQQLALTIFGLHVDSDTPIADFPTALFLSFRYLQPEVSQFLLGLLDSNPSMCRNDTMPWIFKQEDISKLPELALSWIGKTPPLQELLAYTMCRDDLTELERQAINGDDFDERYRACLVILLESGADPTTEISIVSPLYEALFHDDLVSLQVFIRHIQSLQSDDVILLDHLRHPRTIPGLEGNQYSSLPCCIAFKSIRCFEFLIQQFPALMFDNIDDNGNTPLLYAASTPQSADFVDLLLKNGADTMDMDLSPGVIVNPIFVALSQGYLRTADLLADRCSARDLDRWLSRGDEDKSIFFVLVFMSCDAQLTGSIKWLIDRGGAHFYGPGNMPIWYTLFREPRPTRRSDRTRTVILSTLLNLDIFSAKIDTERWQSLSLLHLLVTNGYVEAVRLVLERGADANIELTKDDSLRVTAIDLAYVRLRGEDYPPTIKAGGRLEIERWVQDIHSIIRLLRTAGGTSIVMEDSRTQLRTIRPESFPGALNTHNLMFTKHREFRGDWPRPLPSGESSNPVQKLIETELAGHGIAMEKHELFLENFEHDLEEAKKLLSLEKSPQWINDAAKKAPLLRKFWRLPPDWGHAKTVGLLDMEFYINLETGETPDQSPGLYFGEHDESSPYDRKGKSKATTTVKDREMPWILIIILPRGSPLIPIFQDLDAMHEPVITSPGLSHEFSIFGLCDSTETTKDFDRTVNGKTLRDWLLLKMTSRLVLNPNINSDLGDFIDSTRDYVRKSWNDLPPRPEVLLEEMTKEYFGTKNSIDKIKDFIATTGMVDRDHYLGSTPYQLVNLFRPLHDAIMNNDFAAFGELIEKEDVEMENWEGQTPLELAILLDQVDMASILLAHNAKIPDKPIYKTGQPALHFSVLRANIEMTRLLLGSGVDPNSFSPDGVLPLQFCLGFNPEMASLLMENGADFELAHRNYLMSEMTMLEDYGESISASATDADPNGDNTEEGSATNDEA